MTLKMTRQRRPHGAKEKEITRNPMGALVPRSYYDWLILGIAFAAAYTLLAAAYGPVGEPINASFLRSPFRGFLRTVTLVWPLVAAGVVLYGMLSPPDSLAPLPARTITVAAQLPLLRWAVLFLFIKLAVGMYTGDPEIRFRYLPGLIWDGVPLTLFLFCLSSPASQTKLVYASALLSLFLAVTYLAFGVTALSASSLEGMTERFAAAMNPITVGIGLFLGAFSCLVVAHRLWLLGRKVPALLVGAVAVYLTGHGAITGSRGPVIAFLVCLVAFIAMSRRRSFFKLTAIIMAVGLLWGGMSYLLNYSSILDERFSDRTGSGRLEMYQAALTATPTLLGRGAGSFSQSNIGEGYAYIHNAALEAYYEHGLVGLALYLFVIYGCLRVCYARYRQKPELGTIYFFCLFLFYVVETQFSGNLYSWYGMWALIAFIIVPPHERALSYPLKRTP